MAIYEVAFLLGRTVHEVRYEMTHAELEGWFDYFKRRPPGWREDQRTYMMVSAWAGSKVKPEAMFPSLKALKAEETRSRGDLRGSLFHKLMLEARGGDQLEALK